MINKINKLCTELMDEKKDTLMEMIIHLGIYDMTDVSNHINKIWV